MRFDGSSMTVNLTDKGHLPHAGVSRGCGWAVAAVLLGMTVLRVIYAAQLDLRTDEAYYWTWSKENVLSFLDHPPMIAWFIRFGTAIFGSSLPSISSEI